MSWHLLEDVLGWAAVLLGSIAMTIWNVPVIDPLLSIGISLFILWNVGGNLRKVFAILLQSAPEDFDAAKFQERLGLLPRVLSSHHVHTWSLDGERHVLSVHVVMQAGASREEFVGVKRRILGELTSDSFEHVTVDGELEGERSGGCHETTRAD